MTKIYQRLCFLTLFTFPFAGCESVPEGPRTVEASGVVTLDGEPVEGAAVVFIGDDGQYSATSALTNSQGKFSLNSFEYKTGAVPGSYKVVVTKTIELTEAPGRKMKGEEAEHAGEGAQVGVRNDLPARYQNPNNGLAFVIPDDGVTDLKVELVSK